ALWVDVGDALAWSPKYRHEAERAYRTALERASDELQVNGRNPRTLAAHAMALARTGSLREAKRSIEKAMQADAHNPDHMMRAAYIAQLAGDRAEALAWLQKALTAGAPLFEFERHPEFSELRKTSEGRALLAEHSQ
ncbi:MAG TPA: hypothetical protein VF057_02755, partial [Thermoanaerobaculia bacterium]